VKGELISGLQAGDDGAKDNIEYPSMLYSRSCNCNGDKADGISGRDRLSRVNFSTVSSRPAKANSMGARTTGTSIRFPVLINERP